MNKVLRFGLGAILAATLAQAGVIQNGSDFDVTYDVNLFGTLTGNPITSVLLIESDNQGHSSVQQYPFDLSAYGLSSITHTLSFAPTQALVLGVNLPAAVGDGKTHIFMLVNDAFAANGNGVKFNVLFPNTNYTDFKNRQAAPFDAAQQAWFLSFYQNDGALAAFSPTGSFTPVEFTGLAVITPEPSSLALVGAAGLALFLRRRR